MIKIKPLLICIAIPLIFGFIGNLLGNSSSGFNSIIQPSLTPPAVVFPIVWTILYTLMGISLYLVYISDDENKIPAYIVFGIQLVLNSLWTLFFFRFQYFLFSFWWIMLIIVFVIAMIYLFYKIKPASAYLQIPYLLWLIFAGFLNYSIYLLN